MSALPPLKTKTFIPPLHPALIARPRLTAQVAAGVQGPLTLISAPAGFGKTTVLAEWAAQAQPARRLAWVSLDAGENDPLRFLGCVVAALEQIGGAAPQANRLLSTPQGLPPHLVLEALLRELEAAPTPAVLVLDDYHLIQAQPVHDLLISLLEHLPVGLHLVLATRADPPIPLARLRARGELLELRADDLRFTPAETAAFLRQSLGLALSTAEIEALDARIEGWVTGLQLAALSMRGRADLPGFIRAFSGSHRYILDYLIEEVVDRQPPALQQFLLQTSILEQLSGPLCAALTRQPQAQQILEEMERGNLFLVPLDDERRWYRYHHLFGQLLRARLQQFQAESIAELHRQAAAWLEAQGQPVAAIRHALAAKAYPQAADWLEQYGHARWAFGDMAFMNLLGELPPDLLLSRPNLGVLRAWALILFGQFNAAEDLLRRLPVDHLAENAGRQGFVDLLLAYIAALTGSPIPSRLPGRAALEYIAEDLLAMRNSAEVVYARLLSYQGHFDEAEEVLLGTLRRDVRVNGTTAIPIAVAIVTRLRLQQARLREAAELCQTYARWLTQQDARRFYVGGNLDIAWGEVLLAWNELPRAAEAVQAGIRANEAWNIPHATCLGHTTLARVQLAQGNFSGAAHSLAAAESAGAGRALPLEQSAELRVTQLRLGLLTGSPPTSAAWRQPLANASPQEPHREGEFIGLARLLLFEKKWAEAIQLLEPLAENARAAGRTGRWIEMGLLLALARFALRQPGPAFAQLAHCLEQAEPENYRQVFLDEGAPARELLAAALPGAPAACQKFLQALLAAFPDTTPTPQPQPNANLVEPLTPRELEVLHWLAAGAANREIAARLVITLSAVKKHTGNIYGKLGVTSRTQAVARARQLGLLSP